MYQLIRKLLFLMDAENVHHFAMNSFRLLCSTSATHKMASRSFAGKPLPVQAFGLSFSNPVGLAAGFDKNALYLKELEALGFGFVEIGTVTPKPQAGNDKPRLFRLPQDKALVNRMGFNNEGVKAVAERLRRWKEEQKAVKRHKAISSWELAVGNTQSTGNTDNAPHSPLTTYHSRLIIGGNIGKNKVTPNEDAWKDYEICFRELFDCVDYFVVNVSSPNTPGLRELQEKDSLRKILSHLQTINLHLAKHTADEKPKPLLLKIAPDLTSSQVDDVIDLAMEIKLDGLVVSNTTISREGLLTPKVQLEAIGAGGVSGKPLTKRSTELVAYIANKTNRQLPIIASGGIFTGADAKEKLQAGATLVQVWTGFIYEGPSIVKKIVNGLIS